MGQTQVSTQKPWYKTWWGILLLLTFWPFSLSYWIWKRDWDLYKRAGLIILVWVMFAILLGKNNAGYQKSQKTSIVPPVTKILIPSTEVSKEGETKKEKLEQLKQNVQEKISEVEESPIVAEREFSVMVTSIIIKEVDRKYRYFFDIRNKDTEPFRGTVTISLHNSTGLLLNEKAFSTEDLNQRQLDPGLGMSRYLDTHTGPSEVHGEFGISKFKYKALVGGQVVKQGEGNILSTVEVD